MVDPYDPTDEFNNTPSISDIPFDSRFLISVNIGLLKADPEGYSEFVEGRFADPQEVTPEDVVLGQMYSVEDVKRITGELIDRFPSDEDLYDQSALWSRTVSGLHFFQNANHRTAFASLYRILDANELKTFKDPFGETLEDRTDRLISELDNESIGEGEIYERDGAFRVWREYFEDVLPY